MSQLRKCFAFRADDNRPKSFDFVSACNWNVFNGILCTFVITYSIKSMSFQIHAIESFWLRRSMNFLAQLCLLNLNSYANLLVICFKHLCNYFRYILCKLKSMQWKSFSSEMRIFILL